MTTVKLTVTQRVTYSRTFDMPAERFAAIQANLETMSGCELARYEEKLAEMYIDFQDDVLDADDTEILDFSEAGK